MKKSNLHFGLVFLLLGLLFLFFSVVIEGRLQILFTAFTGPALMGGVFTLSHYFYWTNPKNKGKYAERLAQEQINLEDERKVMLRDKSGRYAYIAGLITVFLLLMIVFSLDTLQIMEGKALVLGLFFYLVFQYVIGIIIFRYLSKKL